MKICISSDHPALYEHGPNIKIWNTEPFDVFTSIYQPGLPFFGITWCGVRIGTVVHLPQSPTIGLFHLGLPRESYEYGPHCTLGGIPAILADYPRPSVL